MEKFLVAVLSNLTGDGRRDPSVQGDESIV